MVACDQGYLCEVCGEEVKNILESELYLRFVTGQISSQQLLGSPERHLRCTPVTAQFIVTTEFPAIEAPGPFNKQDLDAEFVSDQESLMTRGWLRLQELSQLDEAIPLANYPLKEFQVHDS